jgi:hypothetical protein
MLQHDDPVLFQKKYFGAALISGTEKYAQFLSLNMKIKSLIYVIDLIKCPLQVA